MKNPYIYGYFPFVTILLFSSTFGIYAVSQSIEFTQSIGLYTGLMEFIPDLQLRTLLLIMYASLFFMVFSALKLIGEAIHETAMLFFAKEVDASALHEARKGNWIYLVGALATVVGMSSLWIMGGIFFVTTSIYFIYLLMKLGKYLTIPSMLGLVLFELLVWLVLVVAVIYSLLKLYNSLVASLPFLEQ